MTGKAYYITTLADWQRHAARFAHSHFIVLAAAVSSVGARHAVPGDNAWHDPDRPSLDSTAEDVAQPFESEKARARDADVRILVLIEADEGVHLALEDDDAFEPLPHPLSQRPISDAAQAALAPHGVAPGATTFDAAEILARLHPLLKHRVF